MRAIKLRVWNKDKKGWEIHGIAMNSKSGELVTNHNEDFELSQYTGLKDKNGKEIYEGDIISYRYKCLTQGFSCRAIEEGRSVVKYSDCHTSYEPFNQLRDGIEDTYDIIGNIYEHPELLESEETGG